MGVPDFQSLMLPVLMATAEGEISASQLRDGVAGSMKLTEEDLKEMLPSGRQTTFGNRTAWANVFLQRAGLIEKTGRGVYRATSTGLQVLADQPSKIDMKFLERFPNYVEWRQRSAAGGFGKPALTETGSSTAEVSATPEEEIGRSYQILTGAL
jgi:restriction system protein